MKITDGIKTYRNIITMALALIGIGIMAYYDYCDTSCSYLKGDILGIDLKWVGIAYMAAIIAFAAFRQTPFVRALLAAGLGVEVHLYAFQVQNDVYCPFCLAFSVMLMTSFIVNYEVPSAWRENRRRIWLYFLGEVDFPMFKISKLPLLAVSLLGYLTIVLTFSGAVTPAYGVEYPLIVSYGSGPYELYIFSDYFCTPCQNMEKEVDKTIAEMIGREGVKISFVDFPLYKLTPLYAKYFLYAAKAAPTYKEVLYARRVLFDTATRFGAITAQHLENTFKTRNVPFEPYDVQPTLAQYNGIIQKYKVRATPTFIFVYSPTDVRKYSKSDMIRQGLSDLQKALAHP